MYFKKKGTIFPELFKEGHQLDETRPILERYQSRLLKEHYCEICVPIPLGFTRFVFFRNINL